MLKHKQINSIIESELSSIDEKMERICRYFNMGFMPESQVLTKSIGIAKNAETTLGKTLDRLCAEENISWDQEEWDCLRSAIFEHCKLKLVPYEYHPFDLGFDELTGSFLISHGGLDRLDEMNAHPNPVGKRFLLKLKLKCEDSYVWVDYQFEVTNVTNICDDNQPDKRFEGIGKLPGYRGEATLDITQKDGRLMASLYQKVYPIPDDPIWQCKKEETVTCYRYTSEIVDT